MLDSIVDISHHNGTGLYFGAAGLHGVIHKATQGTSYVDPMLELNRTSALGAGCRFGTYHFGTDENGADQARFYLATVGPKKGELLALDFENSGAAMSIQDARMFVQTVHEVVGRWPVIYTGFWAKDLLKGQSDEILARCSLWLAEYGPVAVLPPGWTAWALWQYTDGMVPAAVVTPGIGHCDRDRFQGSDSEFEAFWDSVSAP